MYLDEKYIYLHPVIGYISHRYGFMFNLRFFGNYKKGIKNGVRDYASDAGNDYLFRIVRILFPSTGGALTTVSSATGNFGTMLHDPDVITKLLELTTHVRKIQAEILNMVSSKAELYLAKKLENVKQIDLELLAKRDSIRNLRDNFVAYVTQRYGIFVECFSLVDYSIEFLTNQQTCEEKLGYPKYILEQVFLSFITMHFGDRGLERYTNTLDRSFFRNEPVPDILTLEKLLKERANMGFLTAYGEGTSVVPNNGNAKIYDRKTNNLLTETYPDCVETAVRNLCTMILWNPTIQGYDPSPNFQVDEFLKKYDPFDGTLETRSVWSTIVGDLNVTNFGGPISNLEYEFKEPDTGAEYDLNGNMRNYASLMIRIFNITNQKIHNMFHEIDWSNHSTDDDIKIGNLFSTIFGTIQPNTFTCQVKKQRTILEVSIQYGNELVTFELYGEGHGELTIIGVTDPPANRKDMFYLTDNIFPESFSLFESVDIATSYSYFYKMFGRRMDGNEAYLRYLVIIVNGIATGSKFLTIPVLVGLEHILNTFDWKDAHMLKNISVLIIKLWERKDQTILQILKRTVKSLIISDSAHLSVFTDLNIDTIGPGSLINSENSLSHIELPHNIKHIGDNFLSRNASVISLILPPRLETIGRHFLNRCQNLKNIEFPESLKSIGSNFMSSCDSITNIKMPMVHTIPNFFMYSCASLTRVEITSGTFEIEDDFLLLSNSVQTVLLPNGLKKIGSNFMRDSQTIQNITLPSGIDEIGSYFMSKAGSLDNFVFPVGTGTVGVACLSFCPVLREVTIYSGSFQNALLYSCPNLKRIFIRSATLYEPEDEEFSYGFGRKIVNFNNCHNLELIEYPENEHSPTGDTSLAV